MTNSFNDQPKDTRQIQPYENVFGNIVEAIEDAMRTWSTSPWMPSLFEYNGSRLPLSEIVDRGRHYELHVEVPGMGKENVKIKARSHSVEISAQKSKQLKEEKRGRIYTERSDSAFYRQIPVPEEILPQKITSHVKNGILFVELPKKISSTKSKSR
jgi:HSP20 family protein